MMNNATKVLLSLRRMGKLNEDNDILYVLGHAFAPASAPTRKV
jgi:hypothetical protein